MEGQSKTELEHNLRHIQNLATKVSFILIPNTVTNERHSFLPWTLALLDNLSQ